METAADTSAQACTTIHQHRPTRTKSTPQLIRVHLEDSYRCRRGKNPLLRGSEYCCIANMTTTDRPILIRSPANQQPPPLLGEGNRTIDVVWNFCRCRHPLLNDRQTLLLLMRIWFWFTYGTYFSIYLCFLCTYIRKLQKKKGKRKKPRPQYYNSSRDKNNGSVIAKSLSAA